MANFNIDIKEVLEVVNKEGLYKVENFLNEDETSNLKTEMLSCFEGVSTGEELCFPNDREMSYPFGKICRVQNPDMVHFPNMKSIFSNLWFSNLTDNYFRCPNYKMLQVFFSHEFLTPSSVEGVTRNSVLHVDPYEAFKFMIYVTDCNEDSGAFRYIKGSHIDGNTIRKNNTTQGLLGDKYRLDANPELMDKYSEDDVTYAEAPAGSLLIFTTDLVHGGGIIKEEGLERLGIICHNRRI